MAQLRLSTRFRAFVRKHPTYFYLSLGALIISMYKGLNLFPWGVEIKHIALSMLSSEIGGYQMYVAGIALGYILLRIFIADILNVIIDLWIVNSILSVKAMRDLISILRKSWGIFMSDVRGWFHQYFSKAFIWIDACKRSKRIFAAWCASHHLQAITKLLHVELSSGGFHNRIQGITKNPEKAGLRTVFWLCQIPKVVPWPGFPGGVGVAVFVIRANGYGFKGWLVLSIGTVVRTFTWVGIYILMQKYGPALGPFYTFFNWVFTQ